jgi:hypothetical protein
MDFDHNDQERLEELVQKTRWGEVEDARQRVLERLQAISKAQFELGGISEERVSTLKQRTVQLYLEQVETILDPVDGETTEWWSERWIGEFELPNDEVVRVVGLADYLDLDEGITYTEEIEHQEHGARMPETREVERSTTPPPGLHRNAWRATNRALADQGIEFDPRQRDVEEADIGSGGPSI